MQTDKIFTLRQSELSAAKQALLQKRLKRAGSLTPQVQFDDPIVPRAAADSVPLSFAQQRLWFLQQLEPESPAYNEAIATRFSGPLDLGAFTLASREFIRRHETMRSRFSLVDGQVFQTIDPYYHQIFTVPYVDMLGCSEAEIQQRARAELERPFDLANERPWRTALWQLGEQEFFSLTIMHHIITDGWSLATLYREIGQIYGAFSCEQSSPLPETQLHYGDYAAWQQHWLDTAPAAAQLKYWQQQLHTPLPALELPLDHPRPARPSSQGRRATVSLDAELSQSLRSLSQQSGATLFMVLLTGLFILLNRYSLQEDLLIGTPIAGRTRPELENMLGFFINTLALRADLSDQPTVRKLLQQVRDVTLQAYDHQDIPFEKLVEVLQPERNLNRNPFFQVLFVLQNTPMSQIALRDLVLTPVDVHNETAKFDLELSLTEIAHTIEGYFEFNTDILDEQTVARMSAHFEQVLRAMVADPYQLVSALPLLSSEETYQALESWNETQVDFPCEHSFADYVAAQAERTPTHTALSDEHEQVTYRDLQTRARQMATRLQSYGIEPEMVVGLYTERSVAWGIAVLAIFQAGGVYLPLDPQYPEARTRYILQESGCRLLITTRDLVPQAEALLKEQGGHVLCLEDLGQGSDTAWQDPHMTPENLAYVIYTSGSTGKPKGAMVEQRGMLNHLYAKITALNLSEQDIVAQTASQCFDISIWQLCASWLVGAQTRIYNNEIMRDPRALLTQIERQQVSILEIVPSLLRAFCNWQASMPALTPPLSHLRWLIPTGEALTTDLARLWLQAYPRIPLLNAYGPSECSDDVTHHVIDRPLSSAYADVTVPIGRPLPNMRVYVLDQHMRPQPIGVQGEIYVGGVGVGRGYLADEARTALQFVPDPFSHTGGERLYRTGDRGHTCQDGSIVFTGRIDEQVKIRGYRIEPGEIAAAIREQELISDCAVVCQERDGVPQLVAYVVGQPEELLDRERLRNALQALLPAYMVPTIVPLAALPRTANGKLDRAALPVPGEDEINNEIQYVAPRNPVEEQMAAIWAEVLALPRVGIHDNFFAIGGHSLLIMQVLSRTSDTFQITLPVRALFKTPTVADLAETIEKSRTRSNELRQQQGIMSVSRTAFRQKRSALAEISEND